MVSGVAIIDRAVQVAGTYGDIPIANLEITLCAEGIVSKRSVTGCIRDTKLTIAVNGCEC